MSDSLPGGSGHWGFVPDFPGWWFGARHGSPTPEPVRVVQLGDGLGLAAFVSFGQPTALDRWSFWSVKIEPPPPPPMTDAMRAGALRYARVADGLQTKDRFIAAHEPLGERLWNDLVDAGFAHEVEGRIRITESGRSALN
jgi:hypothetical protein